MTSQKEVRRNEQGMTLIEMVISLLIYGIVVAGALGFAATQNTALHRGLDIMRSLQNARYALHALETDLITLGTNLPGSQPALVVAGRDVIVFNADYASNVANDVFASYIDPDAPNGSVAAMMNRITLPNTSFQYPDTLYRTTAGTRSPGETLMFYFRADSTTARTDDYVLYRKVNANSPALLARNLLPAADGTPFFRYFRRRDFVSAPSVIDSISDTALPIRHKAPIHMSPADTGSSALTDSVRAVRVSFRASNGLVGADERLVSVSRVITFPNSGFGTFSTCGDEPMLGTGLNAAAVSLGGGKYGIQLTWSRATDEAGGEADVARYVIYRQQTVVTSDWGDPYLSIPAGQASYVYVDESVTHGELYQYALAAQDCTPKLSRLATSATVIVP
jgi:prepilin-type N-terminal cleavage/methylation domain-containing protein